MNVITLVVEKSAATFTETTSNPNWTIETAIVSIIGLVLSIIIQIVADADKRRFMRAVAKICRRYGYSEFTTQVRHSDLLNRKLTEKMLPMYLSLLWLIPAGSYTFAIFEPRSSSFAELQLCLGLTIFTAAWAIHTVLNFICPFAIHTMHSPFHGDYVLYLNPEEADSFLRQSTYTFVHLEPVWSILCKEKQSSF